jgi:hypothetical protein
VVGLLFVTVISVVVQFVIMGVITAIIAVLLVVFDSWVNRPGGGRARNRYEESAQYDGTGWSDVRRVESRPQQPIRDQRVPPPNARPAPNFRGGQPNQGQPPRPNQGQQGGRPFPGQQPALRPGQGQPPRPNQGQQPNQGQPPQRAPYRPQQPPPTRREPDYRART